MAVTIATFNVNSIKSRLAATLEWLDNEPVDILLLQELKCVDEAFPSMEFEERGYNIATHGQKTYNGVAILSKFPLDDIQRGFNDGGNDEQARYIEAVASIPDGALRVASAYIPNGQALDSDKFPYKMDFYERMRAHWQHVLSYEEMAVLGGDFNCAPDPIDVYDAAKLDGSICYHHKEREQLRALMHLGLADAFRLDNPNLEQFSWWDYRAGGYAKNNGMRIDHLLLSPQATDCLEKSWIDETPRGKEKPSDHTPVLATLAA